MSGALANVAGFAPVDQHYLLQARQMQALSFSVHIPLVCFGIALPVMVLFAEWLYYRSGDRVYWTLARRWSRVMVALFAAGVITGTVLSFEMGLLWPNFMATFGGVFGLGFAIEGFSFFMEAIFIGIYVYGWGRLSRRAHLLSGIPIVITGFVGSLMVISVNAWMNHPGGFRLRAGRVVGVDPFKALFENTYLWHEVIHMYLAGYIVTGFILAAVYAFAKLRGRWGRYERTAIAIPLTIAALASIAQGPVGDWAARDVARSQPTKLAALEGLSSTTRGASEHLLGWYAHGQVRYGIAIPHLLSVLAFHRWNAAVQGLDAVRPDQRPPVNVVRLSFQAMVGHRHAAGAARRAVRDRADSAQAAPGIKVVLPSSRAGGTALAGGADRRLGGDRGRPPALDRLPGDADGRRGHRRARDRGWLPAARPELRGGRVWRRVGSAAARARPP